MSIIKKTDGIIETRNKTKQQHKNTIKERTGDSVKTVNEQPTPQFLWSGDLMTLAIIRA
jgi:hypothetical protein